MLLSSRYRSSPASSKPRAKAIEASSFSSAVARRKRPASIGFTARSSPSNRNTRKWERRLTSASVRPSISERFPRTSARRITGDRRRSLVTFRPRSLSSSLAWMCRRSGSSGMALQGAGDGMPGGTWFVNRSSTLPSGRASTTVSDALARRGG